MKRLVVLAAVLALPASAASAGGCPASHCGATSSALPGSRYLHLRLSGQGGPLVVYDVVARRERASLPRGIASADRRMFVGAQIAGATTVVSRYALPSGRLVAIRRLPGRYAVRAVSSNGRWTVLTKAGPRRTTRLVVLDTLRIARGVDLNGAHEVEAISADGKRVFLVHWKLAGGYDLKLYDFDRARLLATPTFEPSGEVEKMEGQAWIGVSTRDGHWLLTLYVKNGVTAFVHALDLRRGVGHCVDLPSDYRSFAVAASALVLSPDQRRLYVANPVLGLVNTIDLTRPRVVRTVRFRTPLRTSTFAWGWGPNGAASPDGKTIAFTGNRLVWRYDTASGRLRGPNDTRSYVTGVAFTPGGRSVVAVGANGAATSLAR